MLAGYLSALRTERAYIYIKMLWNKKAPSEREINMGAWKHARPVSHHAPNTRAAAQQQLFLRAPPSLHTFLLRLLIYMLTLLLRPMQSARNKFQRISEKCGAGIKTKKWGFLKLTLVRYLIVYDVCAWRVNEMETHRKYGLFARTCCWRSAVPNPRHFFLICRGHIFKGSNLKFMNDTVCHKCVFWQYKKITYPLIYCWLNVSE